MYKDIHEDIFLVVKNRKQHKCQFNKRNLLNKSWQFSIVSASVGMESNYLSLNPNPTTSLLWELAKVTTFCVAQFPHL